MKKHFLLFVMVICMGVLGMGQVILYEDFNYTPPAYIGGNGAVGTSSNNWTTHSVTTGQTTTIDIEAGNLSYTGLASSSGYKVKLPGTNSTVSRDVNRAITSSTTVLYYSALINVLDATQLSATTPDYFMHFGQTAGSPVTIFSGRLGIKSVNAAANFRLSILNTSGGTTPPFTEFAQDLNFNTTYLVVVKYDRSTSPTTASLWVNPSSIGGSEPSGQVTNTSGTGTFSTYASFCLRNGSGTPKVEIDEIRVGPSWADVTPTGTITVPTVQTSNFVFSSIVQTQMNVSWTNGNGTKRIVKINTTNSFMPPADGTDPTAVTAYSGSGEQVVYNGSASTIPTVTGLTANTTYWFQAWEYNGSGGSTVYFLGSGANNPLSQATAAAATLPVISSPTATSITATSAILGGTIDADGGAPILERGTIWSLNTPVLISDNKLDETGTATGVFAHLRTGLPASTLIHYAAYARNSEGTSISAESTFTTLLGEPSNHAALFVATPLSNSSIVTTWLDNDGTQPATGFLILANTTGTFADPVDGVQPASDANLGDGSGMVYVNHGAQTFTWNGLVSSTPYYFAIYPYTNSGTNIDYKTVPSAPAANATTLVLVNPVAAWTFDSTYAAPLTPSSVAANIGAQATSATLYADGTNGSSLWAITTTDTELNMFGGSTVNDPREGPVVFAGGSYCPAGGPLNSSNGKSMVIKFSMSALQDPILTFATRGTSTGFNTHQWAWSTDGTTFTDFGTNTAVITTSFLLKTLDMSAINDIDGAANVYIRITFTGASSTTGNNRLDNIVIRASAASTIAPTVVTTAATNVQASSATLNGTVNANNQITAVTFEYGTAPATYGLPVAAVPASVSGGTTTAVMANLSGLSQNTTYYYRVNGVNGSGTSNGNELTFVTGCLPTGDAGQISGPSTVYADGFTEYTYTVPAIENATNYIWSFPLPSEIVAGNGTNTVTVIFFTIAPSGNVSVFATNACDVEGGSSDYAINILPVNAYLTVAETITAGNAICYNATQTITVAGNNTTFEIMANGAATMKAGLNIIYLPNTIVHLGGYMLGTIVPNGPYCSGKSSTMSDGFAEAGLSVMNNTVRIYPNPTSGRFTIEQTGEELANHIRVEVFGTLGGKILSTDLQGLRKQELSISGNPPGIYFVKIMTGDKVQTVKIILTN